MNTTEQELQATGEALAVQAGTLMVTDQPSFELAGAMLQTVKGYRNRVGEILDPIIKKAHETHRQALEAKKKLEEPAVRAELAIKGALTAYEQEQARLRRQAEVLAEKERARLEEEARLQAALEAEARGDRKVAEKILEAPHPPAPVFTPPAILPAAPKAEGVSFRDQYRAEVTDLILLVKAVAAGEAPIGMLLPNLPMLNQMARALKEELRIPGVRVIADRVAMVRT